MDVMFFWRRSGNVYSDFFFILNDIRQVRGPPFGLYFVGLVKYKICKCSRGVEKQVSVRMLWVPFTELRAFDFLFVSIKLYMKKCIFSFSLLLVKE